MSAAIFFRSDNGGTHQPQCPHPMCVLGRRTYPISNMWVCPKLGHTVPLRHEHFIQQCLTLKRVRAITFSPPVGLTPGVLILLLRDFLKGHRYIMAMEEDEGRWHFHGIVGLKTVSEGYVSDWKELAKQYHIGYCKVAHGPVGPGWLNYMFKDYQKNECVITNESSNVTLKGLHYTQWINPREEKL